MSPCKPFCPAPNAGQTDGRSRPGRPWPTPAGRALNTALPNWLVAPDSEVLTELGSRDHLIGRKVDWEGGSGTASGIAPDGSLIVCSPDGTTHHLHAGEVHLTPI